MLDIALTKLLGKFQLDIALTAAAGSTLVVIGESGAGKTSLLKLLAGLEQPDAGYIRLHNETILDAANGVNIPGWERPIGYVPQDYALFPHLTVEENVSFGLEAQHLNSTEVAPRVTRALQQVGASAFAQLSPRALSGGQQQRVALGRALVLEPRLLLLDEPLSALDLRTKQALKPELKAVLASLSCVTVYVTHSPSESRYFGDQVAVMEAGKVAQIGTPEQLFRHPTSDYMKAFLEDGPMGPPDAAGAKPWP